MSQGCDCTIKPGTWSTWAGLGTELQHFCFRSESQCHGLHYKHHLHFYKYYTCVFFLCLDHQWPSFISGPESITEPHQDPGASRGKNLDPETLQHCRWHVSFHCAAAYYIVLHSESRCVCVVRACRDYVLNTAVAGGCVEGVSDEGTDLFFPTWDCVRTSSFDLQEE